ncbi:MAG: dihydropteroate synthase [Acidimicrobiales bacterium]
MKLMGIVNVTPDSFSDGGEFFDRDRAIEHGRALFDAGAEIVDVGGESTRPYAIPVDEEEERDRVVDVVGELARFGRVSVDTRRRSVAVAAVSAGATLINDVSASLGRTAAELGVGWVAMHMRGEPSTMQRTPTYHDVVGEVVAFLQSKVALAEHLGIDELYLDPGIGFGKTAAHNLAILHSIDRIVDIGPPVVLGISRKNFLGRLSRVDRDSPAPPKDRLEGSLAAAAWCAKSAVAVLRVHDVAETDQLRRLWAVATEALKGREDGGS